MSWPVQCKESVPGKHDKIVFVDTDTFYLLACLVVVDVTRGMGANFFAWEKISDRKNSQNGPLVLLDTCAWLWLANAHERFVNASCRSEVEAAGHDARLLLAPISMWEVAMKVAKGRLALSSPVLEWIQQSKRRSRIQDAPLVAEVAVDSASLPGSFHSDPADRLIVATARYLNAQLVTGDSAIIDYAKGGFVKVWKL